MKNSHEEVSAQISETPFGDSGLPTQKKIIHFSSGETLEVEDSKEDLEEEQPLNTNPLKEPSQKTKLSFKNVAILIGRISLQTCDFLGEILAGAFGLHSAKYQYAKDQYNREHKTTGDKIKEQPEKMRLSAQLGDNHYGATRVVSFVSDPQEH
ncbi:protein FAM177A1 isoform 1-T1 [Menidia menidia]